MTGSSGRSPRPTSSSASSGGPLAQPGEVVREAEATHQPGSDQGPRLRPMPEVQEVALEAPAELQDLFRGKLPEEPWQNRRYSPDNRVWQAAAMRKRAHARRSNVSLGVCTVDLSGPHEPSPRPGNQIHRDTVSYFLVLSIRPDRTAEKVDMAVQTDDGALELLNLSRNLETDRCSTRHFWDPRLRRLKPSRRCWPRSTTTTATCRTRCSSGSTVTRVENF